MKFELKFLKKSLLFTAVIASAVLFNGCKSKEEPLKELNITYVKSPLNVPSILEKNLNIFGEEFKKDGIEVKFHNLTTGPEQTQALAAGELDILHALGGTSAIIAASNGVELTITNIYSRSPKGFMLISNSENLKSPEDLRGKKVAGPKGTILHQLLLAYLAKGNMTVDDIEFINMGLPESSAALQSGAVDVALLAGPVALGAIKNGAEVVTNGEGLVEGIIVTAVGNDFMKKYPEIVERFIAVNEKTVNSVDENFDKVVKVVSEEVGLSKEEVMEMYTLYDFDPTIRESDITELKNTQDFLIKNGLQEKEIDIESIILKK